MFHYFDSNIKEQFYFESELIRGLTNLKCFDDTTEYCVMTMTTPTMDKFWQYNVTHKDISQFNLGNIPQDKQCLVINAALRGQKSLYEQDLKWKVTRKENGDCELALLFYFDKELASRLGSFTIYKVPEERGSILRQTWIKNSVQRYQDIFELNMALEIRINDVNELYNESKRYLKDIQERNAEAYFTNLSKYTELLNAKKMKIRTLLETDKEQKDNLQIKRKDSLPEPKKAKKRKTRETTSSQLEFPKQEQSSSSQYVQQESFSVAANLSEDEGHLDLSSSDSEDDLLTQKTSNSLVSQTTSLFSSLNIPQDTNTSNNQQPFDVDDDEDSLLFTKTT